MKLVDNMVAVLVRERVSYASRLNERGENDYKVESERIYTTLRFSRNEGSAHKAKKAAGKEVRA